MNLLQSFRTVLKETTSRCPVCFQLVPAEVWKSTGVPEKVYLTRHCPDHGKSTACLASDARFYWLAKGSNANRCGEGCACSASTGEAAGSLGQNAYPSPEDTMESLSTCLTLIEIVDSCNLSCPTCFAASPVGTGDQVQAHPLSELKLRITAVLERKGKIEILQLSGGEPTLHPEFFELIDWIRREDRIDYLLVNTNGVRLARDEKFLSEVGEPAREGNFQLYLQFDELQEAGQKELRGADLHDLKKTVMAGCDAERIPVTLATTVTPDNLGKLWSIIEFGLDHDCCRGVSFQPMFLNGRIPASTQPDEHLNKADIILSCVEASSGKLRFDDFTPLPCGNPNCATIGYLLRTPTGTHSISEFIDFSRVRGF
ncbi:MAG: radical SAM protein [Akkermansiaceae bacterium]